jgi:hypothetical protein
MKLLHDEHHGTKACNDADSRPTLRTGVRDIYLAAPLDAEARAKVHTGLLTNGVVSHKPTYYISILQTKLSD